MAFKFYLSDEYIRTEILEPSGWGDVRNVIERDFDSHGIFTNYTDGTLKLGFSCDAVDILETEYTANGVDGYMLFSVDESEELSDTFTEIFSAEVDFSTRDYDEDLWNAEVNNSTSFLKIKNRSTKKINLNFQQTLDGSNRDRINYNDDIYSLATKSTAQYSATNIGESIAAVQSDSGASASRLYANVGFLAIQDDEFTRFSNAKSEIEEDDRTWVFYTAQRDTVIQLAYDFDIDFDLEEDQGSGTTEYTINIQLFGSESFLNSAGTPVISTFLAQGQQSTTSPYLTILNVSAAPTIYAVVKNGATLGFRIQAVMTTTGTAQFTMAMEVNKFNLVATDRTAELPTVSRWYNLHDAINKQLDFITNDSNFLYSELIGDQLRGYSIDGCLSDLYITNGYQVREINDDDKTPVQSLKDLTDNLKVVGAVGFGVEEIDSPIQVGYYDVRWVEIVGSTGEFYVNENLTYDFIIGDSIGFYNSESLYGVYEITNLTYNAGLDRTTFEIDVSANVRYYDGFAIPSSPTEDTWFYEVLLTNNSTTEERERFRIEDWRHFYGSDELIDLETVEEYKEIPFNDAIYNSVKLGFSKYGNDEDKSGTLEEFETESEWSLPGIKSENTLNLIARWIGSTFLFNESRSNIFSNKPTTSYRNDKDIFFTTAADFSTTAIVDFEATPILVIYVPEEVYENYLSNVVFYSISGATDAGNNGTYQRDTDFDVVYDMENSKYQIFLTGTKPTVNRANDTVTIEAVFVGGGEQKIEANDNMIQTSGLTKPQYIMNQRNTIKRFLLRWGSFINSSIAYFVQSTSKTIRNLFYDVNGDFATEIDTYDLNADCVNVLGSVQENANIESDELQNLTFIPNKIFATKKICDADYQSIQDAHKGKGTTPYGYFTVDTPRGDRKQGWLLNMRRSPIDRIAEFELLERYNPPMVFDGTNYGEVENVAALQVTNFRIEVIVKIESIPISPALYLLADCLDSGNGWFFSIYWNNTLRVRLGDGAGFLSSTGSKEINGSGRYTFFLQKVGLDFQAGFGDFNILDSSHYTTMPAPTVNFRFGAQVDGTNKLVGDVDQIKFNELDGSGNIVNRLLLFEGANDNGVRVLNTAADAPDGTNMIWK